MTAGVSREFRGRQVVPGAVRGVAVVTQERVSFFGGVDASTGQVSERGHQLEGLSVAGKVLVYPGGKGSTGATYALLSMAADGIAPLAMLSPEIDNVTVVGAVLGKISTVDRLPRELFEVVQSGDWIEVDGEHGIVRVLSAPRSEEAQR